MKRRSSERCFIVPMSKDNLYLTEQTESFLRALRILGDSEEISKFTMLIPDIIPVEVTVRDTREGVEVLELD